MFEMDRLFEASGLVVYLQIALDLLSYFLETVDDRHTGNAVDARQRIEANTG